MSWDASAFFMRMAKYSPAGPPPMETIRIALDSSVAPKSRGPTYCSRVWHG